MIIDKLFALMAEKKASDIFITVGTPIHIKIDGNTLPINQQAMDPTMIQRMAYEMMNPEQTERFERLKEMNLSFGRRDMGNFRVNIFWQRNSIAIVVRYILGEIPRLDTLGLPTVLSEVIMEKRGLVLVVGATGSGKSVGLNCILLSLLYRLTPAQCRLILVDPKVLELKTYDDIPHLLSPVVTEPAKAVRALKWAVEEMERRYRMMSEISVRKAARLRWLSRPAFAGFAAVLAQTARSRSTPTVGSGLRLEAVAKIGPKPM